MGMSAGHRRNRRIAPGKNGQVVERLVTPAELGAERGSIPVLNDFWQQAPAGSCALLLLIGEQNPNECPDRTPDPVRPAGAIEAVRESATLADGAAPRGVAIIAHPHPLFGGTMDNKVVHPGARFCAGGWTAVCFNFRAAWRHGRRVRRRSGELQDPLAVVEQVAPAAEGQTPRAGGFSAFVTSHALEGIPGPAARGKASGSARPPAASRWPLVPPDAHLRTLVVHGASRDDTRAAGVRWTGPGPDNACHCSRPCRGHFFSRSPLL